MKSFTKASIMILGMAIIAAIFMIPRKQEQVSIGQKPKVVPPPSGWYEVDSREYDTDHNGILSTSEQDRMWSEFEGRHKDLEGLILRSNKISKNNTVPPWCNG